MKYAATLVVYDAENLTPARRKELAEWLRGRALRVLDKRNKFAKRFRARLMRYRV